MPPMLLRSQFVMDIAVDRNMYAFIRGKLIESTLSIAIIEAQGIGYKLFVPLNLLSKLPSIGQEVLLHTSFVVREASQALYGFFAREERDTFEILIGLSGIGPKTALGVIGHLELTGLAEAVQSNNVSLLSKVPGIGKKTAEKMILDLKGRVDLMNVSSLPALPSSRKDALNALINLGYTQNTAEKAVRQAAASLPEESDLATLITTALKFQH